MDIYFLPNSFRSFYLPDALQRRRKERLWRCLHQLLLAPWGAVRASMTRSIDLFPPDIDAHVLLGRAPPEASSSSSSSSGKVATALGVNEQQARELAGQLRRVMQVAIAMDSVYRCGTTGKLSVAFSPAHMAFSCMMVWLINDVMSGCYHSTYVFNSKAFF